MRLSTWLAVACIALMALGCGGTSSPTMPSAATVEPAASSSSAEACVDAETAAIIQSIRDGGDVATILADKGDALAAGLGRFTPPADATTWRDELVTAIANGDADAVKTKLGAIGSEVTLAFC